MERPSDDVAVGVVCLDCALDVRGEIDLPVICNEVVRTTDVGQSLLATAGEVDRSEKVIVDDCINRAAGGVYPDRRCAVSRCE